MATTESDIEQYLVERVEAAGGLAFKTVSPTTRGFFDRVVVVRGIVVFVEVKKPKRAVFSPQQKALHEKFRAAGANVESVRTEREVDALLRGLTE